MSFPQENDLMQAFKRKVYLSQLFIEGRLELGPCLLWAAGRSTAGYGIFHVGGKKVTAHRWYYEQLHGEINQFLDLDHLCRNRNCVSDLHLEIVTHQENLLRGNGIPAMKAQQTHCIHGHEFNAQNTYIKTNGCRACKTCHHEKQRRNRELSKSCSSD